MQKSILTFALLLAALAGYAQIEGMAPGRDGVQTYYRVYGNGAPILLINGGPGLNSQGFEGLAAALAKKYQVILYDQRGTGRTQLRSPGPETVTMDLMVADIEALRRQLGLQEWVVMGHSFGGILASYYTARHPGMAKGLIASASGGPDLGMLDGFDLRGSLTQQQRDSLDYWSARIEGGDESPEADLGRRRALAAAYLYKDEEHLEQVAARLGQGERDINRWVWEDLRRIGYDVKPELSRFLKPALILQGEADLIGKGPAEAAAGALPNAELVYLPACGHYGWLEQPEAYFSAIDRLMQRVAAFDEKEINKTLHTYVAAIYEADSTLAYSVADSTLQKSGHYYSPGDGNWSYTDMTFEGLLRTAANYNRKGWLPEGAPDEVEIFDIDNRVASAKVKAIWGFDYVLLSQNAWGQWRMDKVLWQSHNAEEAQRVRAGLVPRSSGN
ncbi:alpha/beta fold hydrolase [Phaeodactylibacter luteus]|nr:alpha/beta fold hydrolase [Phaeodactylibacter luteus]